MVNNFFYTLIFLLIFGETALSRPEFAVETYQACQNCHISPLGAGARNMPGKAYGNRVHGPTEWTSNDYLNADLRGFILSSENQEEGSQGFAFMRGLITGHIPVKIGKNEKGQDKTLSLVVGYDVSTISEGNKEAYLLWKRGDNQGFIPDYWMVGRFALPFGLITDEHRSFTKIASNSLIRKEDFGINVGFNFFDGALHANTSLIDGFYGKGNIQRGDFTYGVVQNLLWRPSYPFMLGTSFVKHYSKFKKEEASTANPYAYSMYGVLSFARLTNYILDSNLSIETVEAKNMNTMGDITKYFFSDPLKGYAEEVSDARSRSYLAMYRHKITEKVSLLYKYDHLIFDKRFAEDYVAKHGFGTVHYLDSSISMEARVERHKINLKKVEREHVPIARDIFWMMFRAWL